MFVRDEFKNGIPVTLSDSHIGLRRFVERNIDALANAAGLLAGRKGRRVVDLVVEGLQNSLHPSARTMRALDELLSILSLENVHDEMSDTCGFFAALDPSDLIVAEICLLTDGLRDVLQAARAGGSQLDQDLIVS